MKVVHAANSAQANCLCRLAGYLGITAQNVDVRTETDLDLVLAALVPSDDALVVDVASVAQAMPGSAARLRKALRGSGVHILLLVTDCTDTSSRYLSAFTDGAVSGLYPVDAADASFTEFSGSSAREVAGQRFPRGSKTALGLSTKQDVFEAVLRNGRHACFGQPHNDPGVFVWSTYAVFDLLAPLDTELEFELAIDEYLPAIIFLRLAYGDRCWHAPWPTAALVIDDALLRPSYGFIDFKKILASARKHQYHVTLAFIPWNHWRTRLRDAALFRSYTDVFSLCVHGDDHTSAEFGSQDRGDLLARVGESITRMELHRARTGVPYDAVMVCPQERYSVEALRVIGESRAFLAINNTRCIPDDPAAKGKVRGADLLLPAEDSFGVPVLKRHYPGEGMAKFALALFFGKPAVLVAHHEYFRSGTDQAERFVADLKGMSPTVRWIPISTTLRHLCWRRRVSKGHWCVRFFTDTFELTHDSEQVVSYELTRRIPERAVIESVTVDGNAVEYLERESVLEFRVTRSSRGSSLVVVRLRATQQPTARATKLSYRAKVAVRRLLCELRDNVLSRSPIASVVLTVAADWAPVVG